MKKNFYSSLKLGILGGGQLGRMLIQAASEWNIYCAVMDEDAHAPCKNLCNEFYNASFKDYDAVMHFGKEKDILTIEIEHVNTDALFELEKQGIKIFPQPHIIRMVQDKGLQKQFYKDNNIPTTDFIFTEDENDLAKHLDFLPAFQKSRTQGYDGKGVQFLADKNDIPNALKGKSILEKPADYSKEISVIIARNEAGEMVCFPAVEMVANPKMNLLDYLIAPAEINNETSAAAVKLACMVAEKTGIVGVLAVEMFLLKTGELLVNEIAPRPHNSGHHTIEANYTSQYQQHLRAIAGLPLGDASAIKTAALINLVGEEGHSGDAVYSGAENLLGISGAYLHLYGKKQTKPGRKMGHITLLADDYPELKKLAASIKEMVKVISE